MTFVAVAQSPIDLALRKAHVVTSVKVLASNCSCFVIEDGGR